MRLKNRQKIIKKIPEHVLQYLMDLNNYFKWRFGRNKHESVYFYTFHKCASSLFSNYVLKNIKGLRHVNYASQIYRGKKIDKVTFNNEGFVYGPIRISADPMTPVYKKLVDPTSDSKFIQNKIAIFLIRDPRDILVSAYYSFGYTHEISSVYEMKEWQEQERSAIQSKTIDEYVLESATRTLKNFEMIDQLDRACTRSVVLKYEDMISNWDYFVRGLTKYIDIKKPVLTRIYEKSRPREKEDKTAHRRSGKPGEFRRKLKKETITSLNIMFEDVLEKFKYDA